MKNSFLLSSVALLSFSLIEHVKAQAELPDLPNIGECLEKATDPSAQQYCQDLQSCMDNSSDDQASLTGCISNAQDAYAARAMEQSAPFSKEAVLPPSEAEALPEGEEVLPLPEEIQAGTLKVNSALVEGIQGDKGWSQQQEGPND